MKKKNELVQCDYCECQFEARAIMTIGGKNICLTCVSRLYRVCDACASLVAASRIQRLDGLDYCPECAEAFKHTCEHCGETFYVSNTSECFVNNPDESDAEQLWCPNCVANYARTCSFCGETYATTAVTCVEGRNVCRDCEEENITICDYCENPCLSDNVQTVRTDLYNRAMLSCYCSDCADSRTFTCYNCNERFVTADVAHTEHNGDIYCDRCAEEVLTTCACCGERIRVAEAHYDEDEDGDEDDSGDAYCNSCYEERGRTVYNYSYKPMPKFMYAHGQNTNGAVPFFGVELEIAPRETQDGENDHATRESERLAAKLTENFPFLYCKLDSSLPTGGLELVTHPFTREWLNEHQDEFKTMLQDCRDAGYVSHDNAACGYHIHVGRRFFKDDVAATVLFTQFVVGNWSRFVAFSRRTRFGYCQATDIAPEMKEAVPKPDRIKKAYDKIKKERHVAINGQSRETIEFRLWRGTLKYETFMARFQLVYNTVNLVQDCLLKNEDILQYSFADAINYNTFNELSAYYKTLNL